MHAHSYFHFEGRKLRIVKASLPQMRTSAFQQSNLENAIEEYRPKELQQDQDQI